jgi:hypothetical protein
MAAMKNVTGRARSRAHDSHIENAVTNVNEPNGQSEGRHGWPGHRYLKAASEQELPRDRDGRGIEIPKMEGHPQSPEAH